MKKNYQLSLLVITFFLLITSAYAQRNEWVNQVILGNGGRYETTPPYQDYVTMQKYDPATQNSSFFNTIYTQSVQDILIEGSFAYVAAQDSIVKYNIDTYERVAAVADSGVSRLGIYNNRLIVTKQFPIARFFVEILNTENLALIALVQNITGDCGGVYAAKDSIYVAVNGGWQGMEGRLAVINPQNWTLSREINFGPQAVGIADLYEYSGVLTCVNRTPYGGVTGSITSFHLYNKTFVNTVYALPIGMGIGHLDSTLYVVMNEGLGTINLKTKQIIDTTIIQDPGSVNHIHITSGAVDYVNDRLYVNIGDRLTFGICVITSAAGDSLTSFFTGKSADAIALDYRTPVAISQITSASDLKLYPNPVETTLNISFTGQATIMDIRVLNLTGQLVYKQSFPGSQKTFQLDCSSYPQGVYFLSVMTDNGMVTRKFVRK